MPPRDPFVVLELPRDANGTSIKAAWRRLARENHPDLATDPVAARRATRRMAEINAAYEQLRDPERREAARRASTAAESGSSRNGATPPFTKARPKSTPRARADRPVTGRLDTSAFFEAFAAGRRGGGGLRGQQPLDRQEVRFEPPRASEPTGPLHRRNGRPQRIRVPDLAEARGHELEFGKFRGHTLGQVADFEPSYVDWIAKTISRDPELVAAARVLQQDLDRRGILRRSHAAPTTGSEETAAR